MAANLPERILGSVKSIIIVALLALLSYSYKFDSLCSIHDVTAAAGIRSPRTTTLLEVDPSSDWLYPSTAEFYSHYLKGKEKCSQLLDTFGSASNPRSYMGNHAGFGYSLPSDIQTQCRGNRALWDLSGMIITTFGPIDDCPTYSKCWFGLLSCGTPKIEKLNDFTHSCTSSLTTNHTLRINAWSIRALSVLMRVIGSEIVVPEQRYLTVTTLMGENDDVIVAQYYLTRPRTLQRFDKLASLEVRLFELYPSMLLNTSKEVLEEHGTNNCQVVYLGWNEPRCPPALGTCPIANTCCGCELQSFVYGTPVAVNVTDGSASCIDDAGGRVIPNSLLLCAAGKSSYPGRWIASGLRQYGMHCEGSATKVTSRALTHSAMPMHRGGNTVDVRVGSFNGQVPDRGRTSTKSTVPAKKKKSNHKKSKAMNTAQGEKLEWFEASGDPCSVHSEFGEDGGERHWFFAPYQCRYHFYTREEATLCLRHRNISHIHLAGDSMSRDLLSFLTQYFGIKEMDAAQLKRMTNDFKRNNLTFHASKQLRITESYYWSFDLKAFRILELPPFPDVVITNYALSHKFDPDPSRFKTEWMNTENRYWSNKTIDASLRFKHLIYQSSKEMQGRRNPYWVANVFRQSSEFLRRQYSDLGFQQLDEYVLSRGRYPHTYKTTTDGWHIGGTTRQMEVIVLMNMLCNDWYAARNTTSRFDRAMH